MQIDFEKELGEGFYYQFKEDIGDEIEMAAILMLNAIKLIILLENLEMSNR